MKTALVLMLMMTQEVSPESKVQALYGPGGFARRAGTNYQIGCTTTGKNKVVTASSKQSFDDAIKLSGVKLVQPKPGEIVVWVCNELTPAIAMQETVDNICHIRVTARPDSFPIQSIILYMDGAIVATGASVEILNYPLDMKKASQGPHGLSATATDTGGLKGSSVLAFIVSKNRSKWTCQ